MSEKTQKTPQGEEIPIPKREDFLKSLGKVAKPEPGVVFLALGRAQALIELGITCACHGVRLRTKPSSSIGITHLPPIRRE